MLITSDFVFVHIPKTGGTFINEVVCKLYKQTRFKKRLYKLLNKLNIRRDCKYFCSNEEYPNLNGFQYGQHCGLRHIPKTNKPIFNVKRTPESYYKSLFYFDFYKRVPHLEKDVLESSFSNFPELLPHELFGYYQKLTCKILNNNNLKFGYLTYEIVDQLSPTVASRDKIFDLIQEEKIEEAVIKLKSDVPNMQILNLNLLNDELVDFLRKNTNFSRKKLMLLTKREKLNVTNKDNSKEILFLTEDQKQYELFAFKYWGYL